ncbi:hypothetical protein [Streptomyces sp. NPDC088557]|uniref:hypothetical protein n=1 Tax=Streptomyces sp. NPDC088557 TaxID=3365867 RepID=UPI00382E5B88
MAKAAGLVEGIWHKAVVDGTMSEQTVEKFTQLTDRFIRYAKAQGTLALADVDAGLAEASITARGRSRRGEVVVAAISTMRPRRSVMRTFFRRARQLLLTDADPTLDIALPGRPGRRIRPLDALEAELCRAFRAAHRGGDPACGGPCARAVRGALRRGRPVLPEHVDLAGCRVFAVGGARTAARWCDLDRWSVQCLRRRIEGLPTSVMPLVGTGGGTPAQQQARIRVALRDVLVRAGLGTTSRCGLLRLRPTRDGRRSRPVDGSRTRPARVLGMGSLDRPAELIGYDWRRPTAAA